MAEPFIWQGRRIWIAGHTGLVGSSLMRRLQHEDCELVTASHAKLDLCRQADVEAWMDMAKPDVIVLAAARVGGIGANAARPADFIYDNLAIAQNVIHQAWRQKVARLVYLGSSCIYPKLADQPVPEIALLSGALEPTNEAYAIAKIAGVKLCQFYRQQYGCDFISLMPCNLYGPNDRWHEDSGHVIPALMTRFHQAKLDKRPEVTIWGTGTPLREFLHADDLAEAVTIAMSHYNHALPLNIGSGEEITIADLAALIKEVTGYEGTIMPDPSKPDGTPRKVLDSSRLRALGWKPRVALKDGLRSSYASMLSRG